MATEMAFIFRRRNNLFALLVFDYKNNADKINMKYIWHRMIICTDKMLYEYLTVIFE
jgi:hypothetical protein